MLALEQAQRNDSTWREERCAHLERQLADFHRGYVWVICAVTLMIMNVVFRFEGAVRRDPSLAPLGWDRTTSTFAIPFIGLLAVVLISGLGSMLAFQWLDRWKKELAELTGDGSC